MDDSLVGRLMRVVCEEDHGLDVKDVVLEILEEAGFGHGLCIEVDEWKLEHREGDQDGSWGTGRYYQANPLSGLVVYKDDEVVFPEAIRWLESLWGLVRRGTDAEEIEGRIVSSRPLEPVTLTQYGEQLRQNPAHPSSVGEKNATEETQIGQCCPVHDVCNSWMDVKHISETHNALVCRGCGLRVVYPVGVTTYGELRQYLAASLQLVD